MGGFGFIKTEANYSKIGFSEPDLFCLLKFQIMSKECFNKDGKFGISSKCVDNEAMSYTVELLFVKNDLRSSSGKMYVLLEKRKLLKLEFMRHTYAFG